MLPKSEDLRLYLSLKMHGKNKAKTWKINKKVNKKESYWIKK